MPKGRKRGANAIQVTSAAKEIRRAPRRREDQPPRIRQVEQGDWIGSTPRAGALPQEGKTYGKVLTEHERIEVESEARVFHLASPIILPMIEKRKREAFGRLMQAHKSGRTDTSTIVAELSAFNDLEIELKRKEMIYKTTLEIPHDGRTDGRSGE